MSKIAEIMGEIKTKNDQVCAIWDKVDARGENAEATKDELADVKKLNKEIEDLELKATDLSEGEAMRLAAEARRKEQQKGRTLPVAGEDDKGGARPNPSERYAEARKSIGRSVVDDEKFQTWLKNLAPSGRVGNQVGIQSPQVAVKSLITSTDHTVSGGTMVHIDYAPTVNAAPFKPLVLRDLISVGETLSDLVEFAQITSYLNNAAMVAEAAATDDGSGAKPESGMTMAKQDAPVKTIAHWIPATNRVLSDVAQLRTLIDTFLQFGLEDALEIQMLNGDGTGENFLGILNTPGIQTQAFVTDIITTSRKARTKCKTPGRVTPTGYLLNPLDWEAFDLSKDAQGRYYWGGPSILGNPRLWGLPVVESENIAAGTGLTGDFRYAMLWDRMQAAIALSNSHADFFIRNLVAILAELRAAFGVLYTKAFVSIAFS